MPSPRAPVVNGISRPAEGLVRDGRDGADWLRATVSDQRGVLVLALAGETDLSTERALHDALDRLDAHTAGPIVLDLTGLDFCDVRSLGALWRASEAAAGRGINFALAGMSEQLSRVWQVAFARDLPPERLPAQHATVAAAVAAITGPPASVDVRAAERPDAVAVGRRVVADDAGGRAGSETPRSRRMTMSGEAASSVPAMPPSEAARLAAVRRYDVLDTPPDGAFDRITAVAARLFDVPIAIVSIVDADRIWFKSRHGLDVAEVDRAPGLCASAILQDGPWLITNAATDPHALANPLVAGEFGLRFYAGVPLTTHDGHNLGTLCVLDRAPREVSAAEVDTLTDLASIVMDELELRLAARRAVGTEEQLRLDAQQLSGALQESLLPARLPDVPGLEIVARYHVAYRHLVGGDFYDVVATGSGCAAISGDVAGKGPMAASWTAAARWTLRTLISDPWTPAEALGRLNDVLVRADDDPERSCTVALASIRPRAHGGANVVVGLAGHPHPLVVRRDGSVAPVGGTGPAIGWLADAAFTDATAELAPGDLFVLFTDGLLEALAGHGNVDDCAVRRLLAPLAGSTAAAVAQRLDEALSSGMTLRDDAAFLVIRAE